MKGFVIYVTATKVCRCGELSTYTFHIWMMTPSVFGRYHLPYSEGDTPYSEGDTFRIRKVIPSTTTISLPSLLRYRYHHHYEYYDITTIPAAGGVHGGGRGATSHYVKVFHQLIPHDNRLPPVSYHIYSYRT